MVIEGGCVTVAMYCLIQFYVQLKDDLSEHRPLLKVTAIKLVIFLSFWQTVWFAPIHTLQSLIAIQTLDSHILSNIFRRHQSV